MPAAGFYHGAPASMCACREAFGHVVDRSMALVNHLGQGGPLAVHNIDNLMLRESMDVIGAPALACTCGCDCGVALIPKVCDGGRISAVASCRLNRLQCSSVQGLRCRHKKNFIETMHVWHSMCCQVVLAQGALGSRRT